jgi:hypothetical protein
MAGYHGYGAPEFVYPEPYPGSYPEPYPEPYQPAVYNPRRMIPVPGRRPPPVDYRTGPGYYSSGYGGSGTGYPNPADDGSPIPWPPGPRPPPSWQRDAVQVDLPTHLLRASKSKREVTYDTYESDEDVIEYVDRKKDKKQKWREVRVKEYVDKPATSSQRIQYLPAAAGPVIQPIPRPVMGPMWPRPPPPGPTPVEYYSDARSYGYPAGYTTGPAGQPTYMRR